MTPRVIEQNNDWTLDTNVIINANSGRGVTRELVECIGKNGYLCWSKAIAQEYLSRGATNLKQGCPPVPVAVTGSDVKWFDFWLAVPGRHISVPTLRRLSGAEKSSLIGIPFRDTGDYRFLELARSSRSRRLVTQEKDYNDRAIRGIKRVLDVRCLNYDEALFECQPNNSQS